MFKNPKSHGLKIIFSLGIFPCFNPCIQCITQLLSHKDMSSDEVMLFMTQTRDYKMQYIMMMLEHSRIHWKAWTVDPCYWHQKSQTITVRKQQAYNIAVILIRTGTIWVPHHTIV